MPNQKQIQVVILLHVDTTKEIVLDEGVVYEMTIVYRIIEEEADSTGLNWKRFRNVGAGVVSSIE